MPYYSDVPTSQCGRVYSCEADRTFPDGATLPFPLFQQEVVPFLTG